MLFRVGFGLSSQQTASKSTRTFAAAADAPALMLVALKPIDKAAFAAD
jgi:hypothetical protein